MQLDDGLRCEVHNKILKLGKNGNRICQICENPFYRELWEIVNKKNKNVLIIIEGEPGDGKSWLSQRIAEAVDDSFNYKTVHERTLFKPREFAKTISSEKLRKGNVIVIEEGGVQADHRKWHSFNNMVINYILQTFRYQNLIVIFNVPVIDYIDSDARKLFKFHIETVKVDYNNNMNVYKIKKQTYNSSTKKIYRKFLRYKVNGTWFRFVKWRSKPPSVKLRNKYEELHKRFKKELAEDLFDQMTMMEKDAAKTKSRKIIDIDDTIEKVLGNRKRYTRYRGTRIVVDQPLIEQDFKIGKIISLRIKAAVESRLREEAENNAKIRGI